MTHSYKGGSGKTLFSVNAAHILTRKFDKRVLLIETDFEMPIFFNIFPENKADLFFNNYLNQDSQSLEDYIYPNIDSKLGIIYASPEFIPSDPVHSMNTKWFEMKLNQLQSNLNNLNYDFVIFDLAPGKNLFTALILILSNTIYTTLRPDSYSVIGVKSLIDSFYTTAGRIGAKEIIILFNQIPLHPEINKLLDYWKLKLNETSDRIKGFYEINFDHETAFNVAKSNILLDFDDMTSTKFQHIISDLLDNVN